jgi:hypothetical protein
VVDLDGEADLGVGGDELAEGSAHRHFFSVVLRVTAAAA